MSRHYQNMRDSVMPDCSRLSWWLFWDCFVFLLHGVLTGHSVYLERGYEPPKPFCLTCWEKKNDRA